MTTPRTEPRTDAGRRLLANVNAQPAIGELRPEDIVAIEDEARRWPLNAERLREAAQRVVDSAEPDEGFEGEYVAYLVDYEALDALRAALAKASE